MASIITKAGEEHVMLERAPDPEQVGLLEQAGFDTVIARLVASRLPADSTSLVQAGLSSLDNPADLPDGHKAAQRLHQAVHDNETIGIVTDHDVDGVTSHAVLLSTLKHWCGVHPQFIRSFIGHRLKEGYGLSEPVASRILAARPVPSVIITADCGSGDEPRISRLAEQGVDIIVTDHHEMGAAPDSGGRMVPTPPPSAHSVVNPTRTDCIYPDYKICGAMVSWLLMCLLVKEGGYASSASMKGLLDFVALGTVADCVSLGDSRNNRAVVRYGLSVINRMERPCWRAAQSLFVKGGAAVDSQDLAFGIGPRINARGRLDDAFYGVRFLLSDSDEMAMECAAVLDDVNNERKAIERDLTEVAMLEAEMAIERNEKGLAIWLADGHPGVHGIVGSRVLERFGRPVVCLSPHAYDDRLITGSARSLPGVHIKQLFDHINEQYPELLVKFGGHAAAGGITLEKTNLAQFQKAFVQSTRDLSENSLYSPVWVDTNLGNLSTVDEQLIQNLNAIEPYGQGFSAPLFTIRLRVSSFRLVGTPRVHLKLTLQNENRYINGIWFFAVEEEDETPPVSPGRDYYFAVTPQRNSFRGREEIQLLCKGVVSDSWVSE